MDIFVDIIIASIIFLGYFGLMKIYEKHIKNKKYAIFYGRFQPFHIAHIDNGRRIENDGYILLFLIGTPISEDRNKNPFSFYERYKMIKTFFPKAIILPIFDMQNDNIAWANQFQDIVKNVCDENEVVLYVHNKVSEAGKYGLEKGQYITDLIDLKKVYIEDKEEFANINATDIRNDLEKNKHFLEKEIYEMVKEKLSI
jgi:nicotinamide mononucleotide adenylyltransferase